MKNNHTMCSVCVLHSGVPKIVIDDNGKCSVCNTNALGEREKQKMNQHFIMKLNKACEKARASSGYHALVLLSGGKDSTFLAKMLKEQYGLSILAFAVIHPLVNETASRNMEEAAQTLSIPLIKFYPTKEEYAKIIKYAVMQSDADYIDECVGCNTCSYIFKNAALSLAIKMGIPLVFDGTDAAQNETPIFISADKMKANCQKGMGPFEPMHQIVMNALGDKYKGSLYDFDCEALKDGHFPSYVSPLTFVKYDFKDNFSQFESMGLDSVKYRTVKTNCDAVPFYSYISLKRYDCLTYVRHYANEIRKQKAYFLQSKIENDTDDSALSRDEIKSLIDEYKQVVYYVVDNNLTSKTLTALDMERINEMASTHRKLYGPEVCELFLQQVLMIHYYADFFDIDLKSI